MARAGGNDEAAADRVVHDIETHENRVAEKLFGQVYATLTESLSALETRIAETGQMQAHAVARVVDDKIGAMLGRHTDMLLQATRDAVSTVMGDVKNGFATFKHELGANLDTQFGAMDAEIKNSTTVLTGHVDQKIDALIPQLRDMLNTTEVSVLAKILGLIDARLKSIEARLAGYSGPEQEQQEAAESKRLAKIKTDQAAEFTQIADTADDEATKAAADPSVQAEYEYLASRARELAAQATREAAELLA